MIHRDLEFPETLKTIAHMSGRDESVVLDDFVILSAAAVSPRVVKDGKIVGTLEDEFLQITARYKKDEVDLFTTAFAQLILDMEKHPYTDLLGSHRMQVMGRRTNGEFYTPQNVSDMMALMALTGDALPEDRPLEVMEPACGAGGMVLSTAKALVNTLKQPPTVMRVEAWDVSWTAVLMCFINTTLWGIPCKVVHGDSITQEVHRELINTFYYSAHAPVQTAAEEEEAA